MPVEDIVDQPEQLTSLRKCVGGAQIDQPIGRQLAVLVGIVAIIILAAGDADIAAQGQARQDIDIAAQLAVLAGLTGI